MQEYFTTHTELTYTFHDNIYISEGSSAETAPLLEQPAISNGSSSPSYIELENSGQIFLLSYIAIQL